MVTQAHFVTDVGRTLDLLHPLDIPPSNQVITSISTRPITPHHLPTDPEPSPSDDAEQ